MNRKILVYLGLVIAMITWSLTYIAVKFAYSLGMTPIMLVFFRLIIGAALLTIYAKFSGKLQAIQRGDMKYFILLAFFEPFLYYLGESYGLTYIPATTASVIVSTIPVFTPFAILIFYREKINLLNVVSIILSFTGVMLIVLTDDFRLSAPFVGIVLMFFTVLSAIGYTLLIKKLASKYNSYTIVAVQTLIGSLFFLPLFLASDAWKLDHIEFTWELAITTFGLAFFATILAYILFSTGIKEIGATKSTIFANLIPVITAIAAFMLGTEGISIRKFFGVFIVIAGVFISQSKRPFLGIPELLWSYFFKKSQE